jgi:LuxR family transcriptional regulator, maltose regulon positive regulatory protein
MANDRPGGQKGTGPGALSISTREGRHERPHAPSDLLPRDRLTRTLLEARKPLVLLAAPPGFGKTTLLQQWREAETRAFAEVWINAADDDPVLLWGRIIEALRTVVPSFDRSEAGRQVPRGVVLDNLVLQLAHDLSLVDDEIVLALDDFQNIDGRVHDSLDLFLSRLPSNVTLVLSTRADPSVIPLATLRARGQLLELRAVDLCFSEDEEAAFLNDNVGLGLDPDTLAALHERTEGWPAGVYLASLSLRDAENPVEFVAGFGGSNRHVVDYLTEVVLDSLDPRRKRFLLETSILESITAPLADAVTGHSDSADLLDELERDNLFLVALDDHREWYRYHQLFAGLLRARLLRHDPGLVPELHRRAFEWYRKAGRIQEALRHGVAAGDLAAARELVAERWVPRLECAEARTTLRWLDALPVDTVAADARLLLAAAWSHWSTNRVRDGVHAFRAASDSGLTGSFPDGTTLEAGAVLVEACFPHGDAGAMLAAARRAHDLREGLSPPWRGLASLALGWAEYLSGNWASAQTSLLEAADAAADRDEWLHVSIANASLSWALQAAGDFEGAEASARNAHAILGSRGLFDPLACGLVDAVLGAVLVRTDVAAAEEALRRGLVGLRAHGEPLFIADALLWLAPVRRGLDGTAAGRSCIEEARELLDGCADPGMLRDRLESVARSLTPAYRRIEGASELTEREREVLRYLAEGMPKRDIGAALFLSYNTIHSHTKSIYQKLRVSSRQAAVERARELGAL